MPEEFILGSDNPKKRDLTIIKVCDNCGQKYHPRKDGYEAMSRFCSQECTKKFRRNKKKNI